MFIQGRNQTFSFLTHVDQTQLQPLISYITFQNKNRKITSTHIIPQANQPCAQGNYIALLQGLLMSYLIYMRNGHNGISQTWLSTQVGRWYGWNPSNFNQVTN